MNIKDIEYMNKSNWKYIANGRNGAIIINKERIIVANSHNDCIEILFNDISDDYLTQIEESVYNNNSNTPLITGDIYEKAIVLYYYDHLENNDISNNLRKFCLENNLKLFLHDEELNK